MVHGGWRSTQSIISRRPMRQESRRVTRTPARWRKAWKQKGVILRKTFESVRQPWRPQKSRRRNWINSLSLYCEILNIWISSPTLVSQSGSVLLRQAHLQQLATMRGRKSEMFYHWETETRRHFGFLVIIAWICRVVKHFKPSLTRVPAQKG